MKEQDFKWGVGKISSTGSVVIPSDIRNFEGLKAGDKVSIVDIGGKIVIQKPSSEPVKRAIKALEEIGKV